MLCGVVGWGYAVGVGVRVAERYCCLLHLL